MRLSWNEIKNRATAFARESAGLSRERGEAQTFWNEFFNIFGIRRRTVPIRVRSAALRRRNAAIRRRSDPVRHCSVALRERGMASHHRRSAPRRRDGGVRECGGPVARSSDEPRPTRLFSLSP